MLHLLLLDGTPAVGYRGFINFMAAWRDADLDAVDDALARARSRALAQPLGRCSAPPATFAAVHQPLSLTQSLGGARGARADTRLKAALARHGVAALVSGHLHDAGGLRQHVCHAAPPAACAARATPSPAGGGPCCVLELEAPGWKSLTRHFRISTFAGGHFAFTDVSFVVQRHPPLAAPEPPRMPGASLAALPQPPQLPGNLSADCSLQPIDRTALGTPYLVHIAAPPDARYFPTAATSRPWALADVQVHLVWSYGMHVRAGSTLQHPPQPPHRVTATLSCHGASDTQQRRWAASFDLAIHAPGHVAAPAHPLQASAAVPPAALQRAHACRSEGLALTLQVFAAHEALGIANSELRPIEVEVAAGVPQQPMRPRVIEWLAVRPRWPLVALAVFECLLGLHVLLLVVTWLARDWLGCGHRAPPDCMFPRCVAACAA